MKDEYSCLFHHLFGFSMQKNTDHPFGQSVLLYACYFFIITHTELPH